MPLPATALSRDVESITWTPAFTLAPARVRAWCSTRRGGVSEPPFDALNLAFGIGDRPAHVTANRRHFAAAIDLDLRRAVVPWRSDSDRVFVVDHQDVGRGIWAGDPTLVSDAVVTSLPNVTLMVAIADSVPVYLAATDGRAVAMARVGRRALLNGLLRNTIHVFEDRFGVMAHELCVGLGPSLGPCCSDVDEEGHDRLDLSGLIVRQLTSLGVPVAGDIERAPCTSCQADRFFSKRASNGLTGRQLAGISRVVTESTPKKNRFLPIVQTDYVHSCGG
jgi:purine-nucleoside/S-methyl-5'-thioadenosine phosphorylase / adenosine deaminase